MKILIITEKDFDDSEGFYPYYRFVEEGYEVVVAALKVGEVQGKYHTLLKADIGFEDINVEEYDGLFLVGGKAPERIRDNANVIKATRAFFENGKPIAGICHAQQIMISADILKGKKCTCYSGIKRDVQNAGGIYLDEPVVIDDNLITSRRPEDLPFLMREFIKILKLKG